MKYFNFFCDILGIFMFIDIDECMIKIDNCDSNANCTDTSGSFNCTCNTGYSGNGTFCQGEKSLYISIQVGCVIFPIFLS